MTKDEYMTKKMKILGMLAKMPDDKLQELEDFLIRLLTDKIKIKEGQS